MKNLLHILESTGNYFEDSFTVADLNREDMPLCYVNESFVQLTGYNETEILGRNCRFLQGPLTNRETVNNIRNSIHNRESCYYDLLNYKKDGSIFWNRLVLFPVGHEDQPHDFYVAIQQNVNDSESAIDIFNKNVSQQEIAKNVINPFKKVFNASRGLKYLTLGIEMDEETTKKFNEIIENVREEVTSINQYIKSL